MGSITGSVLGAGWEVLSKGGPSIGRVVCGWVAGHSGPESIWKHMCAHMVTCAHAAQAWYLAHLRDIAGPQDGEATCHVYLRRGPHGGLVQPTAMCGRHLEAEPLAPVKPSDEPADPAGSFPATSMETQSQKNYLAKLLPNS